MLGVKQYATSLNELSWQMKYEFPHEYLQHESQYSPWSPRGERPSLTHHGLGKSIGAGSQTFLGYRPRSPPEVIHGSSYNIGRGFVDPITCSSFRDSSRKVPSQYQLNPYVHIGPSINSKLHNYVEVPRHFPLRPSSTIVPTILARSKHNSRTKSSTDPNHLLKITRKAVADETLAVLRSGTYTLPNGIEVDVSSKVKKCLDRATCFSPDYYFLEEIEPRFPRMIVEVTEESTLQACKRLYEETGGDVGCLAFSSGKNPGGGFLGGSGGQEESIARSSAYYLCVIKDPQLYEYNRGHKDPFHSDHVIVSPEVPVIRNEADPYTLREPWLLTVISAPAVNAGVVRSRNPGCVHSEAEIHRRMRIRIRRILGAAVEHGVSRLVLGEYGCGALENNPRDVARYFKEELMSPSSPFACAFDRVVFAVHDDAGSQICGRQRLPCLAEFMSQMCPAGVPVVVIRD